MRIGFFLCLGLVVMFTRANLLAQHQQLYRGGRDAFFVPDSNLQSPVSNKSPTLALVLSAAVPGLGQVYNGSYWKVPIIVGLGAWFGHNWFDNNDKYKDYRDSYRESISPSLPSGDQQVKRLRDFHRDQRDKFAWYIGILYFANVLDAYVDASLHDFDVSDDLSIELTPTPQGVSLSVRF
ncbi:MAG: DUF5683 domain-containing protein [Bacteroidota bacterium]